MKDYNDISNIVTCCSCGCAQYEVTDSRRNTIIMRRRKCLNCGNRIITYEISKNDFERLIFQSEKSCFCSKFICCN